MGITDPNQNLSLGKLRRATDPGNVSSDSTEGALGANAAGTTTANSNIKFSEFTLTAVSASLSKSKFHDEGTNETIKMQFTSVGSRFIARIAGHNQNFVWKDTSTGAAYNTASAAGYQTVWSAGAISNISTAVAGAQDSMSTSHSGDFKVSMSAAYVDDRVATGFNDHVTNYNKYIVGITQVEDTYNSVAITCFTPDTKLTLCDGTHKEIQELAASYDDDDTLPGKSQHATGLAMAHPEFAPYMKAFMFKAWDMLKTTITINSVYRTPQHQARLMAEWQQDQSKPKPGRTSYHLYGMAFDFNPTLQSGTTLNSRMPAADWHTSGIVALGESVNLYWGGHFSTNYDPIHFDFRNVAGSTTALASKVQAQSLSSAPNRVNIA